MIDEEQLEAAYAAEVAKIDHSPALWERVRAQTEPRRGWRDAWRRMSTLKKASAFVVAVVVLGSLLLGGQVAVARFLRPVEPRPIYVVKAHAPGDHGPDEIVGVKPTVETLTLAQATRKANFTVRLPGYLPAGTRIAEVQLLTEEGGQRVVIQYELATGGMTLQQWPINPKHDPYGKVDSTVPVMVGTADGWLTTVTASGHTTHVLLWSRDGNTFALHAMDVPSDQVLKVAASIH